MFRTIILCILLITAITLVSCESNSTNTNTEEAINNSIEEARTATRSIRDAVQNYHRNLGEVPESFEHLLYLNGIDSLVIDPSIYEQWEFNLDVEDRRVILIKASSTNNMIGGTGYTIYYDLRNGLWTVFLNGVEIDNLNNEVLISESIENAIIAVRDTRNAIRMYYMDLGEYPHSLDELEELCYLKLYSADIAQWDLSLNSIDSMFSSISARSTDNMPGGIGYELYYDLQNGHWTALFENNEIGLLDREMLIDESIEDIREVLRDTRMAIRMYRNDSGEHPDSFELLSELWYLVFYTVDRAQWNVTIEYSDTTYSAAFAESKDDMPGGIGFTVDYDLQDGHWTILLNGNKWDKINNEVLIRESISDIYSEMRSIDNGINRYEQVFDRHPESLEELEESDYWFWGYDPINSAQWNLSFEFEENRIRYIVANSTELMPGGIGCEKRHSMRERRRPVDLH